MSRKYHSPKEYQDAAKSEFTSTGELAELAKSEHNFVKLAVANNANVTEEILDSLVPEYYDEWGEQEIGAALAKNPKTAPKTLGKLAAKLSPHLTTERNKDMAAIAGINLFCNPNAPLDALNEILNSEQTSTLFRRKIARETQRNDVLEILLRDKSEAVRKRALKNISFTEKSPD